MSNNGGNQWQSLMLEQKSDNWWEYYDRERHFFHSTAYLWKLLGSCGDTHSFPVTDFLRYSQLKPSVDNHLHKSNVSH